MADNTSNTPDDEEQPASTDQTSIPIINGGEQQPDEQALSLGLHTLTPAPTPTPEQTPQAILNPTATQQDTQAQVLRDRLESVAGDPAVADYFNAAMGGT